MVEHSYYHPYTRTFGKIRVLADGTAWVSLIGRGNNWFPCQQEAAAWLGRRGYRKVA